MRTLGDKTAVALFGLVKTLCVGEPVFLPVQLPQAVLGRLHQKLGVAQARQVEVPREVLGELR